MAIFMGRRDHATIDLIPKGRIWLDLSQTFPELGGVSIILLMEHLSLIPPLQQKFSRAG